MRTRSIPASRTPVQTDLFSLSHSPAPDVWRIQLRGEEYSFSLKRSARAKNVILKAADTGGLVVVVPRRMKLGGLESIIRSKESWILKHIDPYAGYASGPELTDGVPMPFLGDTYTLRVSASGEGCGVSLLDGEMRVSAPGSGPEVLRPLLKDWYIEAAAGHFSERVAALGQGLRYGRVRMKDTSSRWGSCTPRGDLNFNWRLIAAPPRVVDYIIVHELMHIIRPDHSENFWMLVEKRCPGYREQRKWLRDNGRRLGLPL